MGKFQQDQFLEELNMIVFQKLEYKMNWLVQYKIHPSSKNQVYKVIKLFGLLLMLHQKLVKEWLSIFYGKVYAKCNQSLI